jgi:hypothetical protein
LAEVPMVRSTSSVAAGVPRAFALTTGGFVDTGFDLSNIDGRPHSLSLRFMLQYTNSYYNPFVGASGGGSYLVGKSDVVSEPRSPDPPGLTVNIDGERLDFAFPYLGQGLESGHWYSLVLSIDSARLVSVFLDAAGRPAPCYLGNAAASSVSSRCLGFWMTSQFGTTRSSPPRLGRSLRVASPAMAILA